MQQYSKHEMHKVRGLAQHAQEADNGWRGLEGPAMNRATSCLGVLVPTSLTTCAVDMAATTA